MRQHYKAVILVLASDNSELYKQFKKVYKQYMYTNPNIKVLFVYGKDISFVPENDDLVCNIAENYYPGMITKTLSAMEYVDNTYDYDFLVRTNLSTFWIFDRLLDRLNNLPKAKCFTGKGRSCNYKGTKSPTYISGVNLILSRDLIKPIIDSKNLVIGWDLPEDWALSKFYSEKLNIKPQFTSPASMHFMEKFLSTDPKPILNEIIEANKLNKDHFRVKNLANRNLIDIAVMEILLDEYYK